MIHLFNSVAAVTVSPLPLPVHIVDKTTEGPWATFGAIFAGAAALFAGIAVIVAIITLRRIGEQITLARQQITLAEREVTLVDQDLQNNKRMIDEALRRPDLRPVHPGVVVSAVQSGDATLFSLSLRVSARNVGDRVARHLAAEWLIPSWLIPNAETYPTRRLHGEEYCIIEHAFRGDLIFWPNGVPDHAPPQEIVFRTQTQEADLLLRIYDDAGVYPRAAWYRYRYHTDNKINRLRRPVSLEPLFCFLHHDVD